MRVTRVCIAVPRRTPAACTLTMPPPPTTMPPLQVPNVSRMEYTLLDVNDEGFVSGFAQDLMWQAVLVAWRLGMGHRGGQCVVWRDAMPGVPASAQGKA